MGKKQRALVDEKATGTRLTQFGGVLPDTMEEYALEGMIIPNCPIKILVGETDRRSIPFYKAMGWARMYSDNKPDPYPGEPWAFDNGAWAAFTNEREFPVDRFLHRLDIAVGISENVSPPLFGVVPDIVKGGMESLDFSLDWLKRLQESGHRNAFPWYLAVQGGMSYEAVEEVLPLFDGLFMGGAHVLKPSARLWLRVARSVGAPFHYGGCGIKSKLAHAFELKADSLDSVGPRKSRYHMREFILFWRLLAEQHFPELQDENAKPFELTPEEREEYEAQAQRRKERQRERNEKRRLEAEARKNSRRPPPIEEQRQEDPPAPLPKTSAGLSKMKLGRFIPSEMEAPVSTRPVKAKARFKL